VQFLYKERSVQSSGIPRNPCLEPSSRGAGWDVLELPCSVQGRESRLWSGKPWKQPGVSSSLPWGLLTGVGDRNHAGQPAPGVESEFLLGSVQWWRGRRCCLRLPGVYAGGCPWLSGPDSWENPAVFEQKF